MARPRPTPAVRTYVVDTSVLLSDPAALYRFAEHEVVLPLVVITELEAKRHHPELGWFARQALRLLDDLRQQHRRLDEPVPVGDAGGTLRVELNHADPSVLPPGFRTDSNDARILATAFGVARDGADVTLVTKDMPLRVKAAAVGLRADEYRHDQASDATWTGMAELDLAADQIDTLYADGAVDVAADLPVHTGLVPPPRAAPPWVGSCPTRPSGWYGETARRSACGAAPRSSGSRWTCCSTTRSGSSRSAVGPAPASRRWRCVPGWNR
jgi:PhoH-like ATPase